MVKAIDAHKLRQMKKVRAKVVRAVIVVMSLLVAYLLNMRLQERQRWNQFDILINGFKTSYNSQNFGNFYRGFCHPGLKKNQSEAQYNAAMARISRILGPVEEVTLASYKPATEKKPYHIFLYEMKFKSGQVAVLHLAFSLNEKAWQVYAWKVTARDLATKKTGL